MWGFITAVDNLVLSLGIPTFPRGIMDNNSLEVPSQKSLPLIASLMALVSLGVLPEGGGWLFVLAYESKKKKVTSL